ncbi:MAG: 1-acyl-sn-glycerol-3-phosphate acyltransferase [Cyclobacteriaceae bacterium]|nr:1-acyl-sn-glycerol-3-phosphate acyltransferase [Cyclobacteriaceae bacterium]
MTPPLRYRLLKTYVKTGLKVFFKKWQAANIHHVPLKGPFIFVANHQNAFLDALLVVCGTPRNVWFLARGDVFKTPFAIKLLTFMRIKPVFRFRDGHEAMRKNDRIMNECIDLLAQGRCILLFAEGNHNEPWTSRELQRGFAHIALQYTEKTGNDITLIPTGFHYENHHKFRSRVLVNYGEPISVSNITGHITDAREKLSVLAKHTGEKLRSLILTVPLDRDYLKRKDFLMANRERKADMVEQLQADRAMMETWTPDSVGKTKTGNSVFRWFDPLFLYGRITHIIPHSILGWIVKNKIKDDQFIGSVKVALGVFLVPINYLLLTTIFYLVTREPLWTLGFFISMPVSGLYAYSKG